jgi:hypothetical protein
MRGMAATPLPMSNQNTKAVVGFCRVTSQPENDRARAQAQMKTPVQATRARAEEEGISVVWSPSPSPINTQCLVKHLKATSCRHRANDSQ